MNKAKLLFDVARVLRNKEKITGVINAFAQKDEEEVFTLRNEFSKQGDVATTNVTCEVNLEGKRGKRESSTEFSGSGPCCGSHLRRFFHHRHGTEGGNCVKGFFTRLSMVFGLFSAVKAEEKEGGAVLLSLNLSEVPEEVQAHLKERLNHRGGCHGHCELPDGPHTVESLNGLLLLTLNGAREIEKISLHLDGRVVDRNEQPHTMTATADVQFAW
ncbi:hypothetical protein [Geomesophilobacter sediminis]|uniref:Uncharacterized protein n=1 Tax=Geomesophilobacter sediminis TaxID=2798584 RepID=A0A8J7M158_9BACT|nr:hypothetical protein [Geomesophilobacter sediminis]MBJ6726706.1 hypothetical protein [Geomesophilobacter sediminis]